MIRVWLVQVIFGYETLSDGWARFIWAVPTYLRRGDAI